MRGAGLRPARRRRASPPPAARCRGRRWPAGCPRMLATTGRPASEFSRMAMSSGTSPRNGTPSFSASVPRAAVRENVGAAAAMRAEEIAHVLDDAEERHLDLLEHRDAAPRVDQRQILRRRDDHRAGERHVLRHGQLRVAGAGRHVDDQHVEFAPRDLAQEADSAPTSPSGRARSSPRPRRPESRSTSP